MHQTGDPNPILDANGNPIVRPETLHVRWRRHAKAIGVIVVTGIATLAGLVKNWHVLFPAPAAASAADVSQAMPSATNLANIVFSTPTIAEYPLVVNHSIAVRNDSRLNAEDLTFELQCFFDDKVELIAAPPSSSVSQPEELVDLGDGLVLVRRAITVPRLAPEDYFMLMIQHPRPQWDKWKGGLRAGGKAIPVPHIQNVSFRSSR